MYNQNDDLKYAIDDNGLKLHTEEEIEKIIAEVPGGNDEFSWWWIVQLTNGKFATISAWCDYSGWGCQSGLTEHGVFDTAGEAAKASPEKEEYSNRTIQKNLTAQLIGEQPFALYQE